MPAQIQECSVTEVHCPSMLLYQFNGIRVHSQVCLYAISFVNSSYPSFSPASEAGYYWKSADICVCICFSSFLLFIFKNFFLAIGNVLLCQRRFNHWFHVRNWVSIDFFLVESMLDAFYPDRIFLFCSSTMPGDLICPGILHSIFIAPSHWPVFESVYRPTFTYFWILTTSSKNHVPSAWWHSGRAGL